MLDYFWVRATTSGVWRATDVLDGGGYKLGEALVIMAREAGSWCIDGRPINVIPGLCITCKGHADAEYFLNQRRASMVTVEPDVAVMFEREDDAMFFVRAGVGDRMSRREVEQLLAAHEAEQSGAAGPDDDGGEQDEPEAAAAPRRGRPPGKKAKSK